MLVAALRQRRFPDHITANHPLETAPGACLVPSAASHPNRYQSRNQCWLRDLCRRTRLKRPDPRLLAQRPDPRVATSASSSHDFEGVRITQRRFPDHITANHPRETAPGACLVPSAASHPNRYQSRNQCWVSDLCLRTSLKRPDPRVLAKRPDRRHIPRVRRFRIISQI
jgi:hypothetical protein